MSYSETRTKNIVGFEENWTRFYEFRLCFLSEFFIEPSRFFAGIDAASAEWSCAICAVRPLSDASAAACAHDMQAVLLAKMLRNFRSSAPTMAAFFWWFRPRNRHFYLWSQQLYTLQRRLKVSEFSSEKFIYRPFYERKKSAECVLRESQSASCVSKKTQSAVSFFKYSWLGLMQFNCGALPCFDAPQSRKSEEN